MPIINTPACTDTGRQAFAAYVDALKEYLNI